MSQTIQLRRDNIANWNSVNPVLADGEMGVVRETLAYKIGNGSTAWNDLAYKELGGVFQALAMEAIANPAVPTAGQLFFYSFNLAGRIVPKWVGPSGLDTPVQAALYNNGFMLLAPNTGTSFSAVGTGAPTIIGTVSTPAITPGLSLRASMRRTTITSAATANAGAGARILLHATYRGETFGSVSIGGFFAVTRFASPANFAGQRGFVGLQNSANAPTLTNEPSTVLNLIGLGKNSTDTNWNIMHNDASGTATKIDLGANFPATQSDAVYELILFSPPNSDKVGYRLLRLDTGHVVSGTLNTDLPAKQILLTWQAWMANGGATQSSIMEIMRYYMETDY